MDGNDAVANFIRNISWEALPVEVQEKSKVCLLDVLCAIIVGRKLRSTQIAQRFIGKLFPNGAGATILLGGSQSSVEGAAFVNACAANAADIDDCGAYTRGHPGAQIIPVALAAGENTRASGKEVLTAIVIGYEVSHYLGKIWHEKHQEDYKGCGSWGQVANAAVAARLFQLDPTDLKNALGIADYHAPNCHIMRASENPAMVKHGIAWASMGGIIAAGLAKEGYTGIPSLFGLEEYRDWVRLLGEKYLMVDGVTFKRWASCSWTHPPFVFARNLIRDHSIDLNNIEEITVYCFDEMYTLGNEMPKTEEEAQFNIAWPMASGLLDGSIGPKQMVQSRLNDTEVLSLAKKVRLMRSEELNGLYKEGSFPCIIEIKCSNKKGVISSGLKVFDSCNKEGHRSDHGDLIAKEDIIEKFRWFSRHVIDPDRIERCLQLVESLDDQSRIQPLIDLLDDDPTG